MRDLKIGTRDIEYRTAFVKRFKSLLLITQIIRTCVYRKEKSCSRIFIILVTVMTRLGLHIGDALIAANSNC